MTEAIYHKDDTNRMQLVYQMISSCFEDDYADELTNEPGMTAILEKDSLASQPTLSRFFNRMEEDTLSQLNQIIQLKENAKLREFAEDENQALYRATKFNQVDYAVEYGEFLYQPGTWSHPRRVVFKIEKPYGQMIHLRPFIVSTMEIKPHQIIRFYYGRFCLSIVYETYGQPIQTHK